MSLTQCEFCGATLDLSISNKCPNCGGVSGKTDQGGGAVAPEPAGSPQVQSSETGESGPQPAEVQPSSSDNKSKYVALICGGLFLIVVIVILLNSISSPSYQPSSSVSSYNSGNAESVSGTTWTGYDSDGDFNEYRFMSDGTVKYSKVTYPDGYHSSGAGSWKQNGNTIYMEFNNKYAEYTGTIRGDRMEGNGWNIKGKSWTWYLNKI